MAEAGGHGHGVRDTALLVSNSSMTSRMPRRRADASVPAASPLHPRNHHHGRYDLAVLCQANPALRAHLLHTPGGAQSIDFSAPAAVRELNRALLRQYYGIAHWDIPDGYLCPPVPGRVDYLHGLADLLAADNGGVLPRGPQWRVLDIGVGASVIYPLLGHAEYGWSFVGSDIAAASLQQARANVQGNRLEAVIDLRLQANRGQLFKGVIGAGERFALSLCNPPFHASAEEAARGSVRKLRNLAAGRPVPGSRQAPALNFGGQANELWCTGGEASFLRRMVNESVDVADQVLWFSSLVAKSEHLPGLHRQLGKAGAREVREVAMAQGSKRSRFVAWSFQPAAQRQRWLQPG